VGPRLPRHMRVQRGRGRLTLALAACLVTGCQARDETVRTNASEPVRLVDAAGDELVLARPARRVVSLVPSATETLRAFGGESVLVGRTDFDTSAWSAALPSVGGGLEPNLEAIVALEPDLVVRFAGTQDPRTPARLADLGIAQLAVRPDRIQDIYRTARALGAATGYTAAADSLVSVIQKGLAAVESRAGELPRVRVAYVLGGTPPWVAGPGTYIDEVMSMVGGDNAFADLGALYSSVSPEELLTRKVDVVLVSAEGAFDASLTPGARVKVVGDALEIPGPEVVDAAYRVAELLHGRSLR
jgi:cobalamin transport system substrate-binding protein